MIENPLREVRLANKITQQRMADEFDVTPQYIIRAEQGCYPLPPEDLVNYLWDEDTQGAIPTTDYEKAVGWFNRQYLDFQCQTRKANYGKLMPSPEGLWGRSVLNHPDLSYNPHPFVWWRQHHLSHVPSRIAISKFYCVHPAIVFKFEAQTHLLSTPPESLMRALRESGYSKETLAWLDQAYYTYKGKKRKLSQKENCFCPGTGGVNESY